MMAAFFSWFYIPFITILLPGRTGWFSSNFSAAAAQGSSRFFLILWGILAAFHILYYSWYRRDRLLRESMHLAWREGVLPQIRAYGFVQFAVVFHNQKPHINILRETFRGTRMRPRRAELNSA